MNQEMSEWVTSLIDAALDTGEGHEVISTEEMLAKIDKVNKEMEDLEEQPEEEDICVFSLDAEALYPSLDTRQCSRLCGKLVQESKLEVSGIDYKWASMYIALTCTQAEINQCSLEDVVPVRRYRTGARPQVENVSDSSPGSWRWYRDPSHYSREDRRRLLGKLVEVAVRTTFETHFYQWGGRIYRQGRGGAIGLKATGSVAKVAIEDWIQRLHQLLLDQGNKV